jgi:RHS repeat-associated protein
LHTGIREYDNLGCILVVVSTANGVIAQQLTYSTYGQVLSDTNPGLQPFGFAGGLYDSDTKLVRFGAREYNGAIGRWMTKDPILFNGGDTNLYGYVLQDPVNYFDPSGLSSMGSDFGACISTPQQAVIGLLEANAIAACAAGGPAAPACIAATSAVYTLISALDVGLCMKDRRDREPQPPKLPPPGPRSTLRPSVDPGQDRGSCNP